VTNESQKRMWMVRFMIRVFPSKKAPILVPDPAEVVEPNVRCRSALLNRSMSRTQAESG